MGNAGTITARRGTPSQTKKDPKISHYHTVTHHDPRQTLIGSRVDDHDETSFDTIHHTT